VLNVPFLTKSSERTGRLPKAEDLRVRVSFVCESNDGFSMRALTKIHIWLLIWPGLTFVPLPPFFLMVSTLGVSVTDEDSGDLQLVGELGSNQVNVGTTLDRGDRVGKGDLLEAVAVREGESDLPAAADTLVVNLGLGRSGRGSVEALDRGGSRSSEVHLAVLKRQPM
jgi:hypothetical protein